MYFFSGVEISEAGPYLWPQLTAFCTFSCLKPFLPLPLASCKALVSRGGFAPPQPRHLGPWRPRPLPGPGIRSTPRSLRPRPPWPRVSSGRSSAPRALPPCRPVPSPPCGAGDPGQRSSTPSASLCWKTVSSRRRPSYCVSFAINKWAMGSATADKKKPERGKLMRCRITENGWRQRRLRGL